MDSEDRERIKEYREEMAVSCTFCYGTLAWKKPVIANMEGEYSHVKCAINNSNIQCNQCGYMFSSEFEEPEEDGKRYCPECNTDEAVLLPISKAKASKLLARTTIAQDDPDIYDVED
jgi:hypothetical protein